MWAEPAGLDCQPFCSRRHLHVAFRSLWVFSFPKYLQEVGGSGRSPRSQELRVTGLLIVPLETLFPQIVAPQNSFESWSSSSFKIFTQMGKTAELKWVPLPPTAAAWWPLHSRWLRTEGEAHLGVLPVSRSGVQTGSWGLPLTEPEGLAIPFSGPRKS